MLALCPPNPKELLMIALSLVFRARLARFVAGESGPRQPSIVLSIMPGPIYLAWWVNRQIDDRERSASEVSSR